MKANLGIRAHDLEAENLQELALNVKDRGFSAVQLALAKSITAFSTSTGVLSPGYGHFVKSVFQQHDVRIAVLGCYINIIHPDLVERKQQLDRFKEHIRFARDFGCTIVGTETGSVIPSLGYSEDNFTEEAYIEVVKSVRELVEEAEKFGVIVGIEGGINHPIHTPKRMKRLLEDVPSQNLQVIYDPANFMNLENVHDQRSVMDEAFELFGDRMVIVHAKDFIVDNGEITMVPVGSGQMDYFYLSQRLKKEKPFINILLENTRDPHIADSIRYIQDWYVKA